MSGDHGTIPGFFALGPSYPNPFRKMAEIRYEIPKHADSRQRSTPSPWDGSPRPADGVVSVKIYDVAGRLVRTLFSESQEPGYYRVFWNGKDDLGKAVTSGIYFHHLKAGEFTAMRKIAIMK